MVCASPSRRRTILTVFPWVPRSTVTFIGGAVKVTVIVRAGRSEPTLPPIGHTNSHSDSGPQLRTRIRLYS